MGCDGGTIPRRDEMVKLKKKAEKADKDVELIAKWKHCALTSEELKRPIVACELGMLYNKEALLLALLDKASFPDTAKHIRSLKDVVELNLVDNPSYKPVTTAERYSDVESSEYVCPVTGLEMTGRHRFAYLRGCGCVFSEKALKEVPSELCHKCASRFSVADVIVINGADEDVKRQNEAMLERRILAKQTKLAKKKQRSDLTLIGASTSSSNGPSTSSNGPTTSSNGPSTSSSNGPSTSSSNGSSNGPSTSSSNGASTSSSNGSSSSSEEKESPHQQSEDARPKRGGTSISQRLSKLQSSSKPSVSKLRSGSSVAAVTKKATKDLSSNFKRASEDTSARKVYKSLFHSSDKQRPKAITSNWITYNPYH